MKYANEKSRLQNARLLLKTVGKLKAGETVCILTCPPLRENAYPRVTRDNAETLAKAVVEFGAFPFIIDIEQLAGTEPYRTKKGLAAVRAAIDASDLVIGTWDIYNHLGYKGDTFLTAADRRLDLQMGLGCWETTEEQIEASFYNTNRLLEAMKTAREVRVTSPGGTDFTYTPMSAVPILAICPNYAEVACIPQYDSLTGKLVIDGPIQNRLRTAGELDREPLVLIAEQGKIKEISGDPEQVQRVRDWMRSDTPNAADFDEVGIPTTRIEDNNPAWPDGTHNCHTIHVAIGNNNTGRTAESRNDVVHGRLHADMEIINPTICIDGKTVLREDVFFL